MKVARQGSREEVGRETEGTPGICSWVLLRLFLNTNLCMHEVKPYAVRQRTVRKY